MALFRVNLHLPVKQKLPLPGRNQWRDNWIDGASTATVREFPGIDKNDPPKLSAEQKFESAYCYWFLLKDGKPEQSLDTDGRVYRTDGQVVELAPLY